jgi:predicted N-acetyltransferase YhbS
MQVHIADIRAADTYGLRRRVLRPDHPDSSLDYPGDQEPGAFHLGAFDDDDRLVAVASFLPNRWDERPDTPALQLRGMAVEPGLQGGGIGRLLLEAGLTRARREGAQLVWAKGRDAVLGFYERLGWKAVGDGYLYGPAQLPHHTMVLELP